jgi:serine/threonine-protein kinase
MADDSRVRQLLEEALDSGLDPEAVCQAAGAAELLPQVRRRWQRLRQLHAQLGNLFPAETASPGGLAPGELPALPGYEVQAVLGRGGMGVVYQARHLRLGRTVALKMLLAGAAATADERARFLREARAVAALRHPNVVQVHDVGEHEGRPYFTMEYVEGGSLAQKLAGAPQPARPAAALVATLAEAVQAAHRGGIVHRDLKPANVLLAADGTPRVTDFGLARQLQGGDEITLSGVPMGTPSYMAPEQARGQRGAVGPAADVYALGAILYELLTGRPPFRAETAVATLQQVLADDPVPPARLNPQVPRDLETICLKCLEKDPRRRYPTAAALADDLRRFDRGESIAARPAGWPERAAKWARRRPTAAALLAAAVLMLAGISAAAVWYAGDRAQLRADARSRDRETNVALAQAEDHVKDLRARLDDPVKVRELLSDIDKWQGLVEQTRQDLQRAKSASVGNEALLTEETRDRIQAVEAAVNREQSAYDLAKELDEIAVEALGPSDTRQSQQRTAVAEYERLFAREGLDIRQPDTARFASTIQSSPVRFALVAALDHWVWLASYLKDPQLARLLELARAADPDPWRDRFRDPAVWADRAALIRLANEVDVGRQSPTVLVALGRALRAKGADPTALFERALLFHPRDFWLHRHAATIAKEPGIRIGLALAQLAIRPRSAVAYAILARGLRERGDLPEALVAANRAIELSPNYPVAHGYLGLILRDQKDLPGAVAAFKRAIDLDPEDFGLRAYLGQILQQQGRYAEAEQAYLAASKAQPVLDFAYDLLARFLATCPDDKARDGKRAVEYATTACERSGWKNPMYLDTLAAAYAEAGQFEEAVRYQTRALEAPALKDDFRTAAKQRLELYRQKKPYREERH